MENLKSMLANDFESFYCDDNSGFYDWFCPDNELADRADKLIELLKTICWNNKKFDPAKVYVFFKNSCPGMGATFDEIKVCDIKDGNVIYDIVPCSGHSRKAEVWGKENDFDEPIVHGSINDVQRFFAGNLD